MRLRLCAILHDTAVVYSIEKIIKHEFLRVDGIPEHTVCPHVQITSCNCRSWQEKASLGFKLSKTSCRLNQCLRAIANCSDSTSLSVLWRNKKRLDFRTKTAILISYLMRYPAAVCIV